MSIYITNENICLICMYLSNTHILYNVIFTTSMCTCFIYEYHIVLIFCLVYSAPEVWSHLTMKEFKGQTIVLVCTIRIHVDMR